MPFKAGKTYNINRIGRVRISGGTAKNKKLRATRVRDGKIINFGATGYRIAPNTARGDQYCSRSRGLNSYGFNANTLSRLHWHCIGAKSKKNMPGVRLL